MNIREFCARFAEAFPEAKLSRPAPFFYGHKLLRRFFDSCPAVPGLTSIRNQKLLNLAFSCLEPDEAYLEVGTYLGKTLISAMRGNPPRQAYACDNFSQFTPSNSHEGLLRNLHTSGLDAGVAFYNADFLEVLTPDKIAVPVGLYFYDGAHDEESQYLAIKRVEPLLAREAAVIVDDWRFAEDSRSYAKAGTEKAIGESSNEWKVLYELGARHNGDRRMWWNGVGVFSFRRRGA